MMPALSRRCFAHSLLAAAAGAVAGSATPALAAAGSIAVEAPNLFPENLTYLATTRRFYVGSVRYGRVSAVDGNGAITTVSDDPHLCSTFGILADERHGRLYVCNADPGLGVRSNPARVGRVATVVTLDARTGATLRIVDLVGSSPGKHLPNDVAVDADGTLYVTDTFAPVVYRVRPDGRVEHFSRNPGFAPPPGGGGLDGIALAPSGTIVANNIGRGTLFRIDRRSGAATRVALPGDALLIGADGMHFDAAGRLVIAQNMVAGPRARNAVVVLSSTDDWHHATIDRVIPLAATTYQTVRAMGALYGVQSRLEELFRDPQHVRVAGFTIRRIAR